MQANSLIPAQIFELIPGQILPVEGELLYSLARGAKKEGVIVEIGSYLGRSTACLGSGSLLGGKATVYAVDPHKEYNSEDQFGENMYRAGLNCIVTPMVMDSEAAAKIILAPVDLIFIDGDHSYEAVKKDFELWYPKMAVGGVMAFHDTQFFEGPRRLVREKLYNGTCFKNIGLVDSTTFGTVCKSNSFFSRLRNKIKQAKKDIYYWGVKKKTPKLLRKIGKRILPLYHHP